MAVSLRHSWALGRLLATEAGGAQGGCPPNRGQSLGAFLLPLAGQTELPACPGLVGTQAQAQAKQTRPQVP